MHHTPTLFIYLTLFSALSISHLPVAYHFSSLILISIFPPHISPILPLFPLLFPSTLASICCVWARLHGWRRGKARRGLVSIIHAAAVVHQSSRDPPDACPPDLQLLSQLPLFTCTPCICLFLLSVCVLVCGPIQHF